MSPQVEPRFKVERKPKKPKRLRRVGKKGERDREELAETKPVLLERSRGRCEARTSSLCTGVGVHAHHVRRRSQGGSNDPTNLLWVCFFCHAAIHANPEQARELGMIVEGWR